MYILILDKPTGKQEYRLKDALGVVDLLWKIMTTESVLHPYHLYWWEEGMSDKFNLAVRAKDLKINDFNRKMLRKKIDFETELLRRAELEKVYEIKPQEEKDLNVN